MLSDSTDTNIVRFTRDNIDMYLKELANEYKKISGRRSTAEIVLVGGAAILTNYSFRESTMDVDAVIRAMSTMKEAINRVTDKNGLQNGWINTDFI